MSKMTKHHCYPRSRCPELSRVKWNIKEIPAKKHRAWHLLFGNATPEEVVIMIITEWTPKEKRKEVVEKLFDFITGNGYNEDREC